MEEELVGQRLAGSNCDNSNAVVRQGRADIVWPGNSSGIFPSNTASIVCHSSSYQYDPTQVTEEIAP